MTGARRANWEVKLDNAIDAAEQRMADALDLEIARQAKAVDQLKAAMAATWIGLALVVVFVAAVAIRAVAR